MSDEIPPAPELDMRVSLNGREYLFTGEYEQIDTDLDWYLRCVDVETGEAIWLSRFDISASEAAKEANDA
jgi:hypothetical protein